MRAIPVEYDKQGQRRCTQCGKFRTELGYAVKSGSPLGRHRTCKDCHNSHDPRKVKRAAATVVAPHAPPPCVVPYLVADDQHAPPTLGPLWGAWDPWTIPDTRQGRR